MPLVATSTEQADLSLASANACAMRATRALEQADIAGGEGLRERHDLRACLGTLVAGLQVLDCAPPDSELAADAREIVQRHVLRIDKLLEAAPWGLK